jgi:peptidoglycan/LPS O-acetylase OafA/YrhL
VVSGYLDNYIIYQGLRDRTFSFKDFTRRIRRIFPSLTVVLISCLIFGWFSLVANEYAHLGKHVASSAGFFSNLLLWSESGYFDTASTTKPLLHLWSLGVEEQFYIVWPVLIWFLFRSNTSQKYVFFALTFASFGINLYDIHAPCCGLLFTA